MTVLIRLTGKVALMDFSPEWYEFVSETDPAPSDEDEALGWRSVFNVRITDLTAFTEQYTKLGFSRC